MFWFVREALMRWMLEPFARWTGIKERRSVVRFAEQGYTFIYYSELGFPPFAIVSPEFGWNANGLTLTGVFWLIGLVSIVGWSWEERRALTPLSWGIQYIMQSSPYRNLNTKEFYVGYPHDALSALTKWYCQSYADLALCAFVAHPLFSLSLADLVQTACPSYYYITLERTQRADLPFSPSTQSGSNRSSCSTSRNDARTTFKCLRITSSRPRSCRSVTFSTIRA
jgi:hypothetical protein